jgi:hypothetical protein
MRPPNCPARAQNRAPKNVAKEVPKNRPRFTLMLARNLAWHPGSELTYDLALTPLALTPLALTPLALTLAWEIVRDMKALPL